MGKASRWIVNFLIGKKEDKEKRKNISFPDDCTRTPCGSIPSTPTYKRRWSFGKSASKEKVHKTSKSLDSITPLITQHAALLEWEKQRNNNKKAAETAIAPAETIKTVVATSHAVDRIIKSIEDAAATRIQAAYRSYLARKALCALRALVRLQALVRGHLVRKQTTATLRQMHALMAIQVRARFQRIQMAEEASQLVARSQSSRHANSPFDKGPRGICEQKIDPNVYETKRIEKEKHGYLSHRQMQRRKHGITKYHSGELYISKREHQYDFSFPTSLNSPQICSPTTIPGRASFTYEKPDYMRPISPPNYMANTESSRAKVRSQSEPKQRPKESTKPKGKGTASTDGKRSQQNGQLQGSSAHSTPSTYENQESWFTKVLASNWQKGREYDGQSSASSSHSSYNKLLATYEVIFPVDFPFFLARFLSLNYYLDSDCSPT